MRAELAAMSKLKKFEVGVQNLTSCMTWKRQTGIFFVGSL
jgi:hypothetical protein